MKRLLKNIGPIFVCFIFVISFIESLLFYKDSLNMFLLLLVSVANGINIFLLRTTIGFRDICSLIETADCVGVVFLHYCFVIAYFVAPIILATSIYKVISVVFNVPFMRLFTSKWNRVVIVGYNNRVENLIKDDSINKNKKQLIVLHDKELSDIEKAKLYKLGVILYKYDVLKCERISDSKDIKITKEIDDLMRFIKPDKVKEIILMDNDQIDNFHNYVFFANCVNSGKYSFSEDVIIHCNFETSMIKKMIWDYHDHDKNRAYALKTFSVYGLRVKKALSNNKIYKDTLKRGHKLDEPMHILIVGFGNLGKTFFKQILNQCVVSSSNRIEIDIIDSDKSNLDFYFKENCFNLYEDKHTIRVAGDDISTGELIINTKVMDVSNPKFIKYVLSVSKRLRVDYIALCINKPDLTMKCMMDINSILGEKFDGKILVRMESVNMTKDLDKIYPKVRMMPSDDEVITENEIYNYDLSECELKSENNVEDNRESKESEDEVYRGYHMDTKRYILCRLVDETKMDSYEKVFEDNENELIAIEHRRCRYYSITSGHNDVMEDGEKWKVEAKKEWMKALELIKIDKNSAKWYNHYNL